MYRIWHYMQIFIYKINYCEVWLAMENTVFFTRSLSLNKRSVASSVVHFILGLLNSFQCLIFCVTFEQFKWYEILHWYVIYDCYLPALWCDILLIHFEHLIFIPAFINCNIIVYTSINWRINTSFHIKQFKHIFSSFNCWCYYKWLWVFTCSIPQLKKVSSNFTLFTANCILWLVM